MKICSWSHPTYPPITRCWTLSIPHHTADLEPAIMRFTLSSACVLAVVALHCGLSAATPVPDKDTPPAVTPATPSDSKSGTTTPSSPPSDAKHSTGGSVCDLKRICNAVNSGKLSKGGKKPNWRPDIKAFCASSKSSTPGTTDPTKDSSKDTSTPKTRREIEFESLLPRKMCTPREACDTVRASQSATPEEHKFCDTRYPQSSSKASTDGKTTPPTASTSGGGKRRMVVDEWDLD